MRRLRSIRATILVVAATLAVSGVMPAAAAESEPPPGAVECHPQLEADPDLGCDDPPPPPNPQPPTAPSGLRLIDELSTHVRLSFADRSSAEDYFLIERRQITNGIYSTIAQTGPLASSGSTHTFNLQVNAAGAYCYRVTAGNEVGSSSSPEVCGRFTVPSAPPTNVAIVETTPTQATVEWTDSSNNEGLFCVWAATDTPNCVFTRDSLGTGGSYSLTVDLSTSDTTNVRVSAINGSITGGESPRVSIPTHPAGRTIVTPTRYCTDVRNDNTDHEHVYNLAAYAVYEEQIVAGVGVRKWDGFHYRIDATPTRLESRDKSNFSADVFGAEFEGNSRPHLYEFNSGDNVRFNEWHHVTFPVESAPETQFDSRSRDQRHLLQFRADFDEDYTGIGFPPYGDPYCVTAAVAVGVVR